MLRRFAVFALLVPLTFAGCNKAKSIIAKEEQKLKGSPTPAWLRKTSHPLRYTPFLRRPANPNT